MRTPKEIDVTTSEPSARASRLPTGVRPRARMRGLEEWAWGHAAEAEFFLYQAITARCVVNLRLSPPMLRTVSKPFCRAAAHPQQPIRPQLICWRRPAPARPRAPERGGEFLLQELLEEPADPSAPPRLEGIAPLFTNQHVCCICRHWRYLLRRPLTAGST